MRCTLKKSYLFPIKIEHGFATVKQYFIRIKDKIKENKIKRNKFKFSLSLFSIEIEFMLSFHTHLFLLKIIVHFYVTIIFGHLT